MVKWLRYHKEPFQDIKQKWLATRAYRIEKDYNDKEKELHDILNKFSLLKQSYGYKLVNINLYLFQVLWHIFVLTRCGWAITVTHPSISLQVVPLFSSRFLATVWLPSYFTCQLHVSNLLC